MMSKAITESLITDECTLGFEKLPPGGKNLTNFVVICQNLQSAQASIKPCRIA
jgi:hypothetical protein